MLLNTYNTIILDFIERMVNDGYSESRISRIKVQMNKLLKYLLDNNTNSLNEEIIADFVKETYNFDYYNPINNNQLDKIKYLKNLLEFKATGNYLKKHANIIISNDKFCDVYREYENYLNTKDIKPITKKCKLIKTKLFLNSLTKINDISQLEKIHCYDFINNLDYSLRYKEELTYEVRRIVNWLYDTKRINFNGSCLFPRIVGQSRSNLISYYNNDEIENLLNCVDIGLSTLY